jgi:hypothetical protein
MRTVLGHEFRVPKQEIMSTSTRVQERFICWVIAERMLCRHQQLFSICVWVEIVGDSSVGPHVLPHRLTGNRYRDFLLYDLAKLLENVPLAEHECGTCMIVLRHILAVLREMFWITSIVTDGQVEEVPLHGLFSIFTCGDIWNPVCMQLLLTTQTVIALWMPVRLSATALASSYGCGGPWWDVSRRALKSHGGHFEHFS